MQPLLSGTSTYGTYLNTYFPIYKPFMDNVMDSFSQNPKHYSNILLLDTAIVTNQFVHMSWMLCIRGCDRSFANTKVMQVHPWPDCCLS